MRRETRRPNSSSPVGWLGDSRKTVARRWPGRHCLRSAGHLARTVVKVHTIVRPPAASSSRTATCRWDSNRSFSSLRRSSSSDARRSSCVLRRSVTSRPAACPSRTTSFGSRTALDEQHGDGPRLRAHRAGISEQGEREPEDRAAGHDPGEIRELGGDAPLGGSGRVWIRLTCASGSALVLANGLRSGQRGRPPAARHGTSRRARDPRGTPGWASR